MDFPKKQAQRLMPLYLLEYSEKLFTNHPNPEDPWGGGSDYTAGQGITITNDVISVDDTIAKKSEIPTNYVTTDTEQTITGLKTIGQTSGTLSEVDFSGFTFKLVNKAINSTEAEIKISNSSYDGNQHPHIYSTKGLYVNLAKIRLGDDGSNTYGIKMPDSSTWEADRVLATTDDIPTIPTLATVATSGSYNDLLDKPYIIPSNKVVTTTEVQTITGLKTFEGSIGLVDATRATNTAILPYRFDYTSIDPVTRTKSRTLFNLPTSKPKGTEDAPTEYTLATTDDIPDTTNFVTTNTEQTINGVKTFNKDIIIHDDTPYHTKWNNADLKIEAEKFILSGEITEPDLGTVKVTENIVLPFSNQSPNRTVTLATTDDIPTNYVTTNTMQKIGGSKTFLDSICTEANYADTAEGYRLYIHTDQFQYEHFNGNDYREGINFHLPTNKPSGTIHYPSYTLATTDDIPSLDGYATETWVNNQGYATSSEMSNHPFYRVNDGNANMFFDWDGTDPFYKVYELNQPARVRLNALNPNYGAGLNATYNPETLALDISLDENAIPSIIPNIPLSPVQTLSTLQVNGVIYGIPESKTYISGTGIDITNDTISIDNTVALKSEVPSTATSTSTSTVTPSTIELVFTYEDNTTQTITLMTGATVSTSTTTTLS